MHHTNIIVNKKNCQDFVFDILKKELNFDIKANPDFLLLENESFGIDLARDLGKWAIGKPLVGDTKVSLVISKSMTLEAQNALLKVLEEPTSGTYIFLSLESLGGILPTLISRVRILDLPKLSKGVFWDRGSSKTPFDNEDSEAQKFLGSNLKEKLAMIRTLSKKEDKNEMKELIKNLEEVAYENKILANQMSSVLTAKIFASNRGASPKMLLEWLSAVV